MLFVEIKTSSLATGFNFICHYLSKNSIFCYPLMFCNGNSTIYVLIIGPGLGRDVLTADIVHDVVIKSNLPMVIDADGLWAVQNRLHCIINKENLILTPNAPEFGRLLVAAKSQGLVNDDASTPQDLGIAFSYPTFTVKY